MNTYKIALLATLIIVPFIINGQDAAPVQKKETSAEAPKGRATKIATFDPQEAMKNSEEWAELVTKAEEQFQVRLTAFQKQKAEFDKKAQMANSAVAAGDRDTMKELAKLQKDLEIEERDLQGFSQQIQQELQMAIAQKVDDAVETIAKEQGWDAVFPKFFYAAKDIDITDSVIKKMNTTFQKEKAAKKFKKNDSKEAAQPTKNKAVA